MVGETRAQPIRTAQLIASVMLVGVIAFTLVAIFLHPKMGAFDPELARLLMLILCGLPVLQLPLYLFMRKRAIRLLARRHQEAQSEVRNHQIPPELMSVAIAGAALVEGLGLFGAVIFLLSGQWIVLIAPALSIILIGVQIPGKEGIERAVRLARERS